jgi:hypothetical protein
VTAASRALAAWACGAALGALAPARAGAADAAGDGPTFSLLLSGGAAWSADTPLEIRQRGAPDLRFTARWETRAFSAPPYYAVAVAWKLGGHELALELVHHKLHLSNPPPEVGGFAVSHGYNLLLLGYGHRVGGRLWARLGAGLVAAHPENEVRGEVLPQGQGPFGLGYHLTGPAVSFLVEWRLPLAGALYAAAGARLTAAWAQVPVFDGSADVPNVAAHATLGLGLAL